MRTTTFTKLHLGCGDVTPDTWLNVDGSFNARMARYPLVQKAAAVLAGVKNTAKFDKNIFGHDLRKPLPWADGTFDAVYSAHLIEHLHRDEAKQLLRECLRVLKPGGVARMVVPDLAAILRGYASGQFPKNFESYYPELTKRGDRCVGALLMRYPTVPKRGVIKKLYNTLMDFHTHKWMYDAESIAQLLTESGFVDVRNPAYLESRIENIGSVEQASRILDGAGIVAEGVRPG